MPDTRDEKLLSAAVFLPCSSSLPVTRGRRFDGMLSRSQSFFVLRFGGLGRRRGMLFRGLLAFAALSGLAALLLFFLLLRRFFDSGKFSQNLFALFRSLGAAGQLDRENFLHNLIEFRPLSIPSACNSFATPAKPIRTGRHLCRYARIFDNAAELVDSASR